MQNYIINANKIGGGNLNYSIEILRVFCAVLVVNIHLDSGIREIILPLCRVAVPVFYFITGYFLFASFDASVILKIKKSIQKHANLYVVGIFAYGCMALVRGVYNGMTLNSFAQLILRMLIVGDGILNAYHLWYLLAFIQAAIIIIFAIKLNLLKAISVLAALGVIGSLLLGRYSFLIWSTGVETDYALCRNALTISLPCLLIGALLRRHKTWFNRSRSWSILCVSLGMLYLEHYLLGKYCNNGDIFLFTLPLSIGVFMVFINYEIPYSSKLSILVDSKISLHIYQWHLLVASVVSTMFNKLVGGIPGSMNSLYSFLIILCCLGSFVCCKKGMDLIRK